VETQAYFENIRSVIDQYLKRATQSIDVAVAWFTDKLLFETLCAQARKGISVRLLLFDDDINNNPNGISFSDLQDCSGKMYRLSETLMHNKFCVIDQNVVITGSYNWTYKAHHDNLENITVTTGDQLFALQFCQEFNRILEKHFNEKPKQGFAPDLTQIVKRLELIKKLIELEDTDDLPPQYQKLQRLILPDEIRTIITQLQQQRFTVAVVAISNFIKRYQQLTVYIDPEIGALKLEIKVIETQIAAMTNEMSDIEKLLQDYSIRHHRELGDIIKRILILRKEKFKNDPNRQTEYEEAEKDYSDFNAEYDKTDMKILADLSNEEQQELKQKFRKAANLCHPDKVSEAQQSQAAEMFQALRDAYEQNDLATVRNLLDKLENGQSFGSRSEQITEKMQLISLLEQLQSRVKFLLSNLENLKQSDAFITISEMTDWDIYFEKTKNSLEEQLNSLENA
jgi:hypothetical protein